MPMQWCFSDDREMMVRCLYCMDLFEVGTEVAGRKQCEGGDGGTVTMPEGYWRSLLAECEESCK